MCKEWNLWYRVQAVLAVPEFSALIPAEPAKTDIAYPGIGLAIARDGVFDLAVKAGNNGESHNHNDVGSVTLYKDGKPVLIDVGVESYTARTFSAQRYDIWTMQSAWHNLPTFGGVMQQAGSSFAARDVTALRENDRAELRMEIADAYPPGAGVRSYRRRVTLLKGCGVEIEDHHDGDRPAELSLMLAMRPELVSGAISLPGVASIVLEGAGPMRQEEIAITDARLRKAWPDRLYRVVVPLAGNRLRLWIT